jgi:hypothetical protein
MNEGTDIDEEDGHRPLNPSERKLLRKLMEKEHEILTVANDYAAASWGITFLKNLGLFVAAVVGGFLAWTSVNSGTPKI